MDMGCFFHPPKEGAATQHFMQEQRLPFHQARYSQDPLFQHPFSNFNACLQCLTLHQAFQYPVEWFYQD
jgi:hypothetical protein